MEMWSHSSQTSKYGQTPTVVKYLIVFMKISTDASTDK